MKRPAIEGGTPVREERLPFYRAALDESDVARVAETVRSGWLTIGPRTEEFESRLAAYLGVEHVIAVSSCSEAMLVALKALGVGPGDDVITSSLTFASTVSSIIHTGARPVIVDIEPVAFGADPERIAERITDRTKAVMPVHFGGQACRIEEVVAMAREHGIAVVEDAAHAFGAEVNGTRIGSFGHATAFSFYATKNLTTGEGGALTTDDGDFAATLRRLSYHGMSRDSWTRYTDKGSWYYQVEVPGFKSNMNDMQASLGLSQLDKIDALLARRDALATRMSDALAGSEYFEVPGVLDGNRHTWHLFVVLLRKDRLRIGRDRFIQALTAENIGTSVHFIPVHHHPFFEPYRDDTPLPVCEDYFSRCISLPLYPDMSERDADDVVEALQKIAAYYRAG